ncbi:MAG: hypothetical protein ACRDYA_10045 [Egibacteraceae bacterium]
MRDRLHRRAVGGLDRHRHDRRDQPHDRVSELAAATVKPVALEFGGKSPNVIEELLTTASLQYQSGRSAPLDSRATTSGPRDI